MSHAANEAGRSRTKAGTPACRWSTGPAAWGRRLLHLWQDGDQTADTRVSIWCYRGGMSISTTIVAGHNETLRMDIHELVRRLNSHLGPLLVAALAGSKDKKLPYKWAKPDGPTPGPAFQKRLQLAHRIWISIADAETEAIARAWFIGGNPFLGEDTPITAIREDRHKEVLRALKAFLEDRQDV